jgi:hypothetical protein
MKKTQEEDHDFITTTPTRRPPTPMYQNIFRVLCYSCNNFGHKAINCRAIMGRNTWNRSSYENTKNHYEINCPRNPRKAFDINYNSVGALSYEIECYKCNNFGHISRNYKSDLIVSSRETRHVPFNHIGEQDRTCKRRQEDLKVKGYGFALQAQNRRSHWYIDSGCSNHMTGDKNIFVTLKKEEEGYVTFGNDNSLKL